MIIIIIQILMKIKNNNLINSYTKKDDNELKSRITFSIRYSYHLKGICKKYNIPFLILELIEVKS